MSALGTCYQNDHNHTMKVDRPRSTLATLSFGCSPVNGIYCCRPNSQTSRRRSTFLSPFTLHHIPSIHCNLAWTHQSPTAALCSGQCASPDLSLLATEEEEQVTGLMKPWLGPPHSWNHSSWLCLASRSCCCSCLGIRAWCWSALCLPHRCTHSQGDCTTPGLASHQQAHTSRSKPPGSLILWFQHRFATASTALLT